MACLPYDLSRPQHGFNIRIVDEDGKPIPGAQISGSVVNDESSHLVDELGMKTGQENPAEHWIELHSDGTAVCHAPGCYYKSSVSSLYNRELNHFQDPFAWTVEQNEASPWRPVSGNSWICMKCTWRARLFVVDEKEKYRKTARYYLGEDDKGAYLAAECEDYYTPPRCILKFRKVPGVKQP